MRYVIGVALIVAGLAQVALRKRFAKANVASNSVMFNGRFAGAGWQNYSMAMSVIVGVVFAIAGILTLAGVFHTR